MKDATISLNKTQPIAVFPAAIETAKNRFHHFTFSNHFDRTRLGSSLEQKLPSLIATALTVTKIAPAVLFAIEKLAIALEKILNAGVSTLNCAYSPLFNREIVVLDTGSPIPPKSLEKPAPKKDPVEVEPTLVREAHCDLTAIYPLPIQDDEPLATDIPLAADDVSQDTPVHEEPTIDISQDDTAAQPTVDQKNASVDRDDDLDSCDNLAIIDDLDKAEPEAPSNRSCYLTAGSVGLLAIAAYVAMRVYDVPNPFNYFFSNNNTKIDADTGICLPDQLLVRGNSFQELTQEEQNRVDVLLAKNANNISSSALTWMEELRSAEKCYVAPRERPLTNADTATCHFEDRSVSLSDSALLRGNSFQELTQEEQNRVDVLLAKNANNISSALTWMEELRSAEKCYVAPRERPLTNADTATCHFEDSSVCLSDSALLRGNSSQKQTNLSPLFDCVEYHTDLNGKTEWCETKSFTTACRHDQYCLDNPELLVDEEDKPAAYAIEDGKCNLFYCNESFVCEDTCDPEKTPSLNEDKVNA